MPLPLIDIKNMTDLLPGDLDYRISSFIVDDLNNDDLNDLLIGVDLTNADGSVRTIIIRALQVHKLNFNFDKIDLDIGSFVIIDAAPFESKDNKEFLIFLKN